MKTKAMETRSIHPRYGGALLFSRLLLLATLILWIGVAISDVQLSLRLASQLLILTTIGIGVLLVLATRSQWSAAFLSFIPLALFHVGLYVQPAISGSYPSFVLETGSYWFVRADHGLLTSLIAIGLSAFALGLVTSKPIIGRDYFRPLWEDSEYRLERVVFAAWGSYVLVASVSLWFLGGLLAGGPQFFLMSYRGFLDATEGGLVGLTYIGIGIGLVLAVQDTHTVRSKISLGFFLAFSIAGYPLGLRGEVLMPLVAAVVVYMSLRENRPRWLLVLGSGLVLVSIPAVKEIRRLGVGNGVSGAEVAFRPLEGIEEMGASARVLNTSISWHSHGDEPFLLGRTYYTYASRLINTLTGGSNVPASSDFGLMNVEISSRVGNIGGSLIAEAHHNFGVVGVMVIPWIFGLIIGAVASKANTPKGMATLGIVVVILMMHVRNTFGPLTLWAAVGAATIMLASRSFKYVSGKGRDVNG